MLKAEMLQCEYCLLLLLLLLLLHLSHSWSKSCPG
jgi:hypothetical protein